MATRPLSYALLLVLTTTLPAAIATATTSPHRALLRQTCQPTSPGVSGNCSTVHDSGCCLDGRPRPYTYTTFACSPRVTGRTSASLTLDSFAAEEDGGGGRRSSCDGRFHSDSEMVVALSTGWFSHGRRCGKRILIRSPDDGRTASATVVHECDSMHGCDEEHGFEPPCDNDVVVGSVAVWEALGFACDTDDSTERVTWSDE